MVREPETTRGRKIRETTGIMKRKKFNIKRNNISVGHKVLEASLRSEETVHQDFYLKHCSEWRLWSSQRYLKSCYDCGTNRSLKELEKSAAVAVGLTIGSEP